MPSVLFSPLSVRGVTIRNRIWVSPLCQYSVERKDGVPTDWHLVHLGSMAVGGAGLVMSEATAVVPEGRISPQDTGIWNDEQVQAWRRIVAFLHDRGAVAGMQLAHAGRKASVHPELGGAGGSLTPAEGAWTTVAPSAVAFPGYTEPVALDAAGIDEVVEAFAGGAERAIAAGFDLVEVHAAHGYLLHQFLSPLSNTRTDEYGGSLENRARIVLRVVGAIRERLGESVPVFVRFSGTDWVEDGWNVHDTATVAGWAREAGADLFDVSSGGNLPGVRIPVGPGYQVPLAAHVREQSDVAVNAVGLVTEPRQAEDIVAGGHADAVMMGRQLMREPHFPLRAAHELGVEIDYWPAQYLRARWR